MRIQVIDDGGPAQFRFEIGQRVKVKNFGDVFYISKAMRDKHGAIYAISTSPDAICFAYLWRDNELEPAPEPQP